MNYQISTIFFLIYISFFSCNSDNNKKTNQEWESPNGYLFPALLANGQTIWNVNGTANDTLQIGVNELIFRLENFTDYTSNKINPNIRIKRINKISFELLTDGKTIKTYYPQILDSIGKLTIEFNSDSDSVLQYEYNVNMELEFAKTDSTYMYNGLINLRKELWC